MWLQNQQYVPTINFGVDPADPANGLFTTANFAGASQAQLDNARDLFAVLTGRVLSINGEQRLDESIEQIPVPRARRCSARVSSTTASSSPTRGASEPNLTVNLGLRYDLQLPFYPRNNSYSKATIADVWGRSGVGNLFSPERADRPGPVLQPVQRG